MHLISSRTLKRTFLVCKAKLELYIFAKKPYRDHPFTTSAFLRGVGVENWPNLPTDISKKLPTEGGRGQKS